MFDLLEMKITMNSVEVLLDMHRSGILVANQPAQSPWDEKPEFATSVIEKLMLFAPIEGLVIEQVSDPNCLRYRLISGLERFQVIDEFVSGERRLVNPARWRGLGGVGFDQLSDTLRKSLLSAVVPLHFVKEGALLKGNSFQGYVDALRNIDR